MSDRHTRIDVPSARGVPDLADLRRRKAIAAADDDISSLGPAVFVKNYHIKPAKSIDGASVVRGLVIGFERVDGNHAIAFHVRDDLERLRDTIDAWLERDDR